MGKMTRANVYIIESNKDDEEKYREGEVLAGILRLDGKATRYHYIHNKGELKQALLEFKSSKYRYLHLACHGSKKSIFMTNDKIMFAEFGKMVRPYLEGRRLFISACWAVRASLAKEVFRDSKRISLIGPNYEIYLGDAAIAWATFYHLIFKEDRKRMIRRNISPTLRKINRTFETPLTYYTADEDRDSGYRKVRWDL